MKILQTERLYLRKWEESDADALYELAKDPQVGPAAGWMPYKSQTESKEITRNVFQAPETYAVIRKSDDRLVGYIGLRFGADSTSELTDP